MRDLTLDLIPVCTLTLSLMILHPEPTSFRTMEGIAIFVFRVWHDQEKLVLKWKIERNLGFGARAGPYVAVGTISESRCGHVGR